MNTPPLDYQIVVKNQHKFVFLPDGFFLDEQDLSHWMTEKRDEDPDLYAQLVQIYFQLKK